MHQALTDDAELRSPMAKRSRGAAEADHGNLSQTGSSARPRAEAEAAGAITGVASPDAETIASPGSAPPVQESVFAADLELLEEPGEAAHTGEAAGEPPPIDWNQS